MNVNVKTTPAIIHAAPSVVRLAVAEDATEIWRLFLQDHRENGLFTLAPDKVTWFLSRALCPETIHPDDTGTRGVIGVIGPVGSLEALVFLTIGQFWYSNDYYMQEYVIYVDPEYRKSHHIQALIQWIKDQVEITRLPIITSVISNIRTEAKCRLYQRMLPKIGEIFYLSPKNSSLPSGTVAASS